MANTALSAVFKLTVFGFLIVNFISKTESFRLREIGRVPLAENLSPTISLSVDVDGEKRRHITCDYEPKRLHSDINWLKNGVQLMALDNVHETRDYVRGAFTLHDIEATERSKNYTCVVSNRYGSSRQSVMIVADCNSKRQEQENRSVNL